jgi:tetratricopeptide (TPR) repeat protein
MRCRCHVRRWLTVIIGIAALAAESPAAFAQPAAQIPAVAPESPSSVIVPSERPTPEQVGDALMMHQRYQAAIEAYKNGPRDSADVWDKMGIAQQMMFNTQEATRCYQMSLKLDPKSAHALNNLGTLYDSLRQFGAAERMYRRALKFDPQSALIRKNLGTNLLAQHKYKSGWEAYKTALAIDPQIFENKATPRIDNPASAHDRGAMNYYMAKGCAHAGQNNCAIEYLRMALNEGFTNPRKIVADAEFASLRGVPAFEQLLAEHATQ